MAGRRHLVDASPYTPDPAMVRIASERTDGILRAWSAHMHWGPVDFRILAESCYMQGINDAIDALQQRELKVVPIVDDGPWEGYCG